VDLAGNDRPATRELALLLLSLGENTSPPGSRDLAPTMVAPQRGEKVWEASQWRILYRVTESTRLVEVAIIQSL
jgi:hypothetical protein